MHQIRGIRDQRGDLKFSSRAEARFYDELDMRQRVGDLVMFLRQVRIDLPGNVRYALDFVVFEHDGTVRWIDVKGKNAPRTREHVMKRKLVEALYPITIEEVER